MKTAMRISLLAFLASVGCSTLIGLEDWTPMPEGAGGSVSSDGGGTGGAAGGAAPDGSQPPPDGAAGAIGTGGMVADGSTDAPVEAGPPPKLTCATVQLTGSGKDIGVASTAGGTDNFKLSCAQGSAPDVAFDWIVPATDYYSVNTAGSSFDTVLGVLLPTCSGKTDGGLDAGADGGASNEIACNNDTATTSQSEIVRKFQKGDRVLLVVDGSVGATGNVVLSAEPITCPAADLSDQTLPATFTNAGALVDDGSTTHDATCGGKTKPTKAFRWAPKTAGLYRFTVTSAAFSPVLYAEDGARCGDPLLQCSKGEKNGYPAEVTRWLEAGQPTTLIVDTLDTTGNFSLDAKLVTGQTCPSHAAVPLDGTDITIVANAKEDLSPSCGQAGSILNWNVNGPYGTMSSPLKLSVPLSGSCQMKITSADRNFIAYLVSGTKCDGPEARCTGATSSGPTWDVTWSLGYADSGDYVLVVQNPVPFNAFTYQVTIMCIA
jgi:hypothetical protein